MFKHPRPPHETARTCAMPIVSLTAFKERIGGFIFVRIPTERGRYLRTHVCVAYVACSHCKATIGEPCKRDGHYTGATHYIRNREFVEVRKALMRDGRWELGHDVIDPADGANVRIIREK